MKKTAKQYVYDAVNYMRKPATDIALSPIQDSDNVFETYGWEKKDVCKLVNAISIDCEIELPHNPIHEVETVGEIVEIVEDLLTTSPRSMKDMLYMLEAVKAMDISGAVTAMTISLVTLRTLLEFGKVDTTPMDVLDKSLRDIIEKGVKVYEVAQTEEFAKNVMFATREDFYKRREELVEGWSNIVKDAQNRAQG